MEDQSSKTFFSYARADSEFVLRLAKDLRSSGASIWVDQLDIPAGERWDGAVESGLKSCRSMVVVLSPQAAASHNVLDEMSFALETNKKVIPIIHSRCDVPFRLRRLQHIDFTVDYSSALIALLSALNVAPQGVPSKPAYVAPDDGHPYGSGDKPDVVNAASRSSAQVGIAYLVVFGIPAILILVGVSIVVSYLGDGMNLLGEYGATMLQSETMLFVYLGVFLIAIGAYAGVFLIRRRSAS